MEKRDRGRTRCSSHLPNSWENLKVPRKQSQLHHALRQKSQPYSSSRLPQSDKRRRKSIGADILIYQDLEDLIEAVTRKGGVKFNNPHCAFFNGDYPARSVVEVSALPLNANIEIEAIGKK